MNVEEQVASYYTRGGLEEKILAALVSAGKNLEQLSTHDLALLDNFHVGGQESTEALAGFMELRAGMDLLDVGCGVGGPARYFSKRGCRVTGIDLTEEFVRVAQSLTRLLKLDGRVQFRQCSALELPFHAATFDGAYMIHVGMNIEDKVGVFREVARVLKSGGHFAIFDIMWKEKGAFDFPLPWALTQKPVLLAARRITDTRSKRRVFVSTISASEGNSLSISCRKRCHAVPLLSSACIY